MKKHCYYVYDIYSGTQYCMVFWANSDKEASRICGKSQYMIRNYGYKYNHKDEYFEGIKANTDSWNVAPLYRNITITMTVFRSLIDQFNKKKYAKLEMETVPE